MPSSVNGGKKKAGPYVSDRQPLIICPIIKVVAKSHKIVCSPRTI